MYIIDQDIANEIANSQSLTTRWSTEIFKATEEEADRMELEIRAEVKAESDYEVARAVAAYLPLYLENEAITKFISKKRAYSLRLMMPEILSPREAALMAQQDYMMTSEQTIQTIAQIKKYQARFQSE